MDVAIVAQLGSDTMYGIVSYIHGLIFLLYLMKVQFCNIVYLHSYNWTCRHDNLSHMTRH